MKLPNRIKIMVLLSALILPMSLQAEGFAINQFWTNESQLEEWAVNNFSNCVYYIKNDSNGGYITGTLLNTKKGNTILLTNYHILNSTSDIVYAYFETKSDNKRLRKYRCKYLDGSKKLDLAAFSVLKISKAEIELIENGVDIELSKNREFILSERKNGVLWEDLFSQPNKIKRGWSIMFLGFPLDQGLQKGKEKIKGKTKTGKKFTYTHLVGSSRKPVARYGRIASTPEGPNFLIDAMVNHGNSGSPVFIRNSFAKGDKFHVQYLLVGILRGFMDDNIDFHSNTGRKISLPHNSGLGVVISIKTILDFISDL